MDDATIQTLKSLFYDKIMLYNDLVRVFGEERESLTGIDMDRLWRLSQKKEEICSEIKSVREQIIMAIGEKTDPEAFHLKKVLDGIPVKSRPEFLKLYHTVVRLKWEIEVRRKENMLLINDSLHFMDEMITVLSGETGSGVVYNAKCHVKKPRVNALLRREA